MPSNERNVSPEWGDTQTAAREIDVSKDFLK